VFQSITPHGEPTDRKQRRYERLDLGLQVEQLGDAPGVILG
jgi:hypothetical protein